MAEPSKGEGRFLPHPILVVTYDELCVAFRNPSASDLIPKLNQPIGNQSGC